MEVDFKKNIDTEEIKDFPGFVFEGEVTLIDSEEAVDEAVAFLADFKYLGFDTETKPSFKKGEFHYISLLQLAVENRVFLFRLNKCGFPPSIRNLLGNAKITKIGVGIHDDIRLLKRLGDFKPASFVDLQSFVEDFGIEEKSFSKLMAIIFGVKISKRQRTSNWEATVLTEPQVRYAATDAWGALRMYGTLSTRIPVVAGMKVKSESDA